jgi:ornithine cyclodeaminase/alanine dehydrogenase-like protein (mu-crystallin family)
LQSWNGDLHPEKVAITGFVCRIRKKIIVKKVKTLQKVISVLFKDLGTGYIAYILMIQDGTLLLNRGDVASILTIEECIPAVEAAFRLFAEGKAVAPKVLGFHADGGGFHIKAGMLGLSRSYFVAKINANFPGNSKRFDLPAIQGVIIVMDAANGKLLAVLDSIEITIIRTGAATAVAAKWLAPADADTATICGCGNQGRISLKAIMAVRPLTKVYVYDIDEAQVNKFSKEFSHTIDVVPVAAGRLIYALQQSQVVVTCTPSKEPFIRAEQIRPGTFIAAVGADSEEKQELFPELLAANKVVVDIAEQSASIGEFHHAIEKGIANIAGIHAEIGSIIAGKKPGRESGDEIIIFDSTGTALQDVAAAAIVYEGALKKEIGTHLNFAEQKDHVSLKKKVNDIAMLKQWFPFR